MTTGKYKDAATSFSQVKPQDTVHNWQDCSICISRIRLVNGR